MGKLQIGISKDFTIKLFVERVFSPEALSVLSGHGWPGNVRELANVIEHAIILCPSGAILPEHLPGRFSSEVRQSTIRLPEGRSLREIEMQAIHEALDRHHGNKPKAAEELGISLKTLYNKLNQAQGAPMSKSA